MGLFDIFKKNENEQEQAVQPEVQQPDNVAPATEGKDEAPADIAPTTEEVPQEEPQQEEQKKGFFGKFFTREKKETLDQGL